MNRSMVFTASDAVLATTLIDPNFTMNAMLLRRPKTWGPEPFAYQRTSLRLPRSPHKRIAARATRKLLRLF